MILIVGCDPIDDSLKITNQASTKIYYLYSPYRELVNVYDRTLQEQGISITYRNVVEEIDPFKTKREIILGRKDQAWRDYINSVCEDGRLRIYIFDIDTLKKYELKFRDVAVNNRFASKIEVTVEDLEKSNWEIRLPLDQ